LMMFTYFSGIFQEFRYASMPEETLAGTVLLNSISDQED